MSDVENYTERDYAGSSIRIVSWVDRDQAIISINVYVGPHRSDLSATFPLGERTAAATHYAFVQNGARAGRTEAGLIADLQRTPVTDPAKRLCCETPAIAQVLHDDLCSRPIESVARYRQRHGRAARLTAVQEFWYKQAQRVDRQGILTSNDVSWLTLRALVEKGWATVLEREDGREAGKILRVRVLERTS